MRALRTAALALLAGCGGDLQNEPLTLGVVRGTLVGQGAGATVSVVGRPELVTSPGPDGTFELQGVPQGPVELLALISMWRNERVGALVRGGEVTDVGRRSGRPTAVLEVELYAPASQRLDRGSVTVGGTPLSLDLAHDREWRFRVPAGCYQVAAAVPGLGSQTAQVCVREAQVQEVSMRFAAPDGSAGREGCARTGCEAGLECRPDGSCEGP